MKKSTIYFDYAATTPVDLAVIEAMRPYFFDKFYNPSATYLVGKAAKADLENARQSLAQIIGARPGEIILLSGATEANNLAIQGVIDHFKDGELIVSAVEHDSVLNPAIKRNAKIIPVDSGGVINLKALSDLITDKTVLVSIMLINNELGSIQPISKVAEIIADVRDKRQSSGNKLPIYLHSDGAQAANTHDIHVARLGVDLMSINGGKIYGPRQTGLLFKKSNVLLEAQQLGGGQEQGLRSGTENVGSAVGLSVALKASQENRKDEAGRLNELRQLFILELHKYYPAAVINGPTKNQSPHLLSITFPGHDNERLMMELDEAGVQVALGSACSASSQLPSHVLKAIGLSDELARSTLRLSFGRQTTQQNIIDSTSILGSLLTP